MTTTATKSAEMVKRIALALVKADTLSLCGSIYTVKAIDDIGMELVGPRGKKVFLVVNLRGFRSIPDAVAFSLCDHRGNLGTYALLSSATVERIGQ